AKNGVSPVAVPVDRVKEIISLNRKGKKATQLLGNTGEQVRERRDYEDILSPEGLTRFDNQRSRPRKKKRYGRKDQADRNPGSRSN
ncbi:MAG: hypothetical protein AB7V25_10150, partial [Mangrovibacterium sp.]